jgi:uncharacterized integral membrane protein
MRYVKYAFLALIGLTLLTLALANRQTVALQLLPQDMATFLGFNFGVELPLFLVILGGVVTGLVVGFVWEWLREHRHRAEAARARKDAKRLEDELGKARVAKAKASSGDDELLALIEDRKAS